MKIRIWNTEVDTDTPVQYYTSKDLLELLCDGNLDIGYNNGGTSTEACDYLDKIKDEVLRRMGGGAR